MLITFGLLSIGIINGCGDDEVVESPEPEAHVQVRPTITVMADPPPGSLVDEQRTEYKLTFSEKVIVVIVNGISASGSGRSWTVTPILPLGPAEMLNIEWRNCDGFTGTLEVGPYEVGSIESEPPKITSGTVIDAEVDVDPAPINAGGFWFDFDEPITGTVKLTDEAGNDLNWIGIVHDKTATLFPLAGQELVNKTTYKIDIDVQDSDGKPLQKTIVFVTKPE